MNNDHSRISLFRLAPESEGSEELALRYASQLSDLLNADTGLPESIRGTSSRSDETPEHFLSYTSEWCKAKHALNFAVLLDGEIAIGNMSLSHIDIEAKTARTGCFFSSRHEGVGYAAYAFAKLIETARNLGIKSVSGDIPDIAIVESSIWEKCGAKIEMDKAEVLASIL
ncbi:MAG: GNAT family N-acetyltransferase [Alphaproteobacteria bacterium]|nr:GNAT family N-acetyltransferase [Alphaproteobacteria bacterium]